MADVLNELTNLSETLQSRNTTLPKAHTLLNTYTKRIESLIAFRGDIPSCNVISTSRTERRKKPSKK